jgi:hypothetical protein
MTRRPPDPPLSAIQIQLLTTITALWHQLARFPARWNPLPPDTLAQIVDLESRIRAQADAFTQDEAP